MGQVSKYLRRINGGYEHWCPGCGETHVVFDRWSFDGNMHKPTFSPSVKITGKQCVIVNGEWTGEWVRDANGNAVDMCCHYFLRAGKIEFCGDCTHSLSGKTVSLPELPERFRDIGPA